MKLVYHKRFQKQFLKLGASKQQLCEQRVALFLEEPTHPLLNVHSLKGKYTGHISLNVGGDMRVIFRYADQNTIELLEVGTHSQSYG